MIGGGVGYPPLMRFKAVISGVVINLSFGHSIKK
jgi:hypothetical protein